MLERIVCKNREEWLSKRIHSIGASEVAAAVGLSPFKSPLELWQEKTGRKEPKDLSGNPFVQFGVRAEEHLRGLYLAEHPNLRGEYHPYDILYQTDIPYLTCTLDCELIDTTNDSKGILEIKTAETGKKKQLEQWDNRIPDWYYAQILHQQIAAGIEYKFSTLYAKLRLLNGNSYLREYDFSRDELANDREWLLDKAERFWWFVKNDKMPPVTIT